MAITWIDKHNHREDYPEVVEHITNVAHLEEPHAKFEVYVTPKFNPMDPLEWSARVTGPNGRRHVNITQRKPGGNITFSHG